MRLLEFKARRVKRVAAMIAGTATLVGALLSSQVHAQGDTSPVTPLGGEVKPETAVRITISGEIKLSMVARNNEVFKAALGDAILGASGSPLVGSTSAGSGGDVFFDPMITLNLDVELANRLTAFVQLETQFNELQGRSGGAANADRDLEVEQAYLHWESAFEQEYLALRFGVQDYSKDFAGNGNPFFLDVAHSENPFMNPAGGTADLGSPQSSGSGAAGSQEAAGALIQVDVGDGQLDLFYFTINETFRKNSDDVMFGATFEQDLDIAGNSAHLGVIIMAMQNDANSYLWTLGGGGFTELAKKTLKLYGEFYVQAGRYNTTGGRKIDQEEAYAGFVGIRFQLPGLEKVNAYLDASYWEVSGDDEGDDANNENFVSFENNNDTVVLEDGYYGLDLDTNYRALKLKAGFTPWERISVDFLYAFFELQENNGTADNTPSNHDRLGHEIDVSLVYRPGDNLNFRLRTGWLLDAKALGLQEDINITVLEAAIQF